MVGKVCASPESDLEPARFKVRPSRAQRDQENTQGLTRSDGEQPQPLPTMPAEENWKSQRERELDTLPGRAKSRPSTPRPCPSPGGLSPELLCSAL